MDNFGIFKLLNSFLNFYEQNKANTSTTKNASGDGSNNLFSSLFSSLNSKTSQPPSAQKENSPKAVSDQIPYPPLQSGMISTMRSHDEFIARVKAKQK